MEPFKFESTSGSPFQGGGVINGYTTFRWTERYRGTNEFEIDAPLSSGLQSVLPLGTLISHIDTKSVMVVEDHQISEEIDKESMLKITGRGLDSFFEQRFVGANLAWNDPEPPAAEYILPAGPSLGLQIKQMIDDHIILANLVDAGDELPYLEIVNATPDLEAVERVVKRSDLYSAVNELLDVGDYGMKVERQGNGMVNIVIHAGVDVSADVTFAWIVGELDKAEYLWTSRERKNTAYVKGRYVEEFVYTGASKWQRRVVIVEADDLDDYLEAAPTGEELATIRQKMATRGSEALDKHNDLDLAQVDVSAENQHRYRGDYNIGDIVAVSGNFGAVALRRVTEYTEVEDENGETGHPTLSALL
jgi:hypothetical protein